MERLNDILRELGISKVKLAKCLGVSRQMIYNYLELDDINISREVKVNGIALTEEEKNNNKIVLINGKYYLDLSKFDTTQNISVEYFTKN